MRELPRPCLMLVTDRRLMGGQDGLVRAVESAVSGGVNAVQVREKDLESPALETLVIRLRGIVRDRAILLVNTSHIDHANGVHLPDGVAMPETADEFLVGRSVHSVEAARLADDEGADYLVAGPIYQTNSHPDVAPAGIGLIRRISEVVSIPVLAIGGIDYRRAPEVMDAGAAGVAVISAILASRDPREATSRLRDALARSPR